MKIAFALAITFVVIGCTSTSTDSDTAVFNKRVEASCGQCQFAMTEPPGCDLAVRMGDEVYFVDGAGIDDFGDAHAADGFCQSIRRARVTGCVKNGRFHVKDFAILPTEDQ